MDGSRRFLTIAVGLALAGLAMPPTEAAGELTHREEDGRWTALPLESTRVEIDVRGFVVRGSLRQVFHNPGDRVLEVHYLFPTPERAAIDRMRIRVGDRTIVADVREKPDAQRAYRQAADSGRKAALVDRALGALFRTSVANVNPGERVEVEIGWTDEAHWADGAFRYAVPLVFTPPAGAPPSPLLDGIRLARASRAAPVVECRLRIDPGVGVAPPRSDSHPEVLLGERGGDGFVWSGALDGDRDFEIEWRPPAGREPEPAWFVEERDGARYATLMLVPSVDRARFSPLPSETVFVVDVSGSMAGPSIGCVRAALDRALSRLGPGDAFNLVRFNDGFVRYAGDFVPAGPAEIEAARAWVAALRAGGGTRIRPALEEAFRLAGATRRGRLQRIVFLTDGAVGDVDAILERIAAERTDVRIHALGIGPAPNRYLMRRLARLGGGVSRFVGDPAVADDRIDGFFRTIDAPVLSDLSIESTSGRLLDVEPSILPDLHAGEPLVVAMRLEDGGEFADAGELVIRGWGPDGRYERRVSPRAVAVHAGIASRWARERIDTLEERMHFEPANGLLRDEIVALGLEFDLVTRFTSLVAVEQRPTAIGPATGHATAATLPLGGTDEPRRRRLALLLGALGLSVVCWLQWTRAPA